jgi:hypothetical protein
LSAEHCSGNKTVPTRVATTCRKKGHRQDNQRDTEIYAKREEKHRTTREKMEGTASPRGIKNRHYA